MILLDPRTVIATMGESSISSHSGERQNVLRPEASSKGCMTDPRLLTKRIRILEVMTPTKGLGAVLR
jgi:hypothetical protein